VSPSPRASDAPCGARLLALAILVLGTAAAGCVNMTTAAVRQGNPIDEAKLASLKPGVSTLQDVLTALGAPLEVHAHPEGRLLVWRRAARNTFRVGLDAGGWVLNFVDMTRVLSSLLGFFHLNLESIHADEDRVAILFGRDGIVRGIGVRRAVDDLPIF